MLVGLALADHHDVDVTVGQVQFGSEEPELSDFYPGGLGLQQLFQFTIGRESVGVFRLGGSDVVVELDYFVVQSATRVCQAGRRTQPRTGTALALGQVSSLHLDLYVFMSLD